MKYYVYITAKVKKEYEVTANSKEEALNEALNYFTNVISECEEDNDSIDSIELDIEEAETQNDEE